MGKDQKPRIRRIEVQVRMGDGLPVRHLGYVSGYVGNGIVKLAKSQRDLLQMILRSSNCRLDKAVVEQDDSGVERVVILCRPSDLFVASRTLKVGTVILGKKKRKKKKPVVVDPEPVLVPRRIEIDPAKVKGAPFRKTGSAKDELNGRE